MSNNRVSKYEIQRCNNWLAEKYGRDANGNPNWRIVWSNDQLEKRKGTFTDFDPNQNFVRTVTEVRELPKYPFNQNCYVLESRAFYDGGGEIEGHNGYEMLYPFQDKNDKRVDPDLEAIQFMFEKLLFHVRKPVTTEEKAIENDREKFNADVERIERSLEP